MKGGYRLERRKYRNPDPKKRFDEVNEKLKALREENKALTEANQRLQKFESDFAEAKTTLDLKRCRSRIPEKRIRGNRLQDLMSSREEKIALAKEIVKIKQQEISGGKNNGN